MNNGKKVRIAMAVTNDLVTDRRVDRHCRTLMEAGCEVLLIGRRLPESTEVERPYATHRMVLRHRRGPLFYAEFNIALARYLRSQEVDIVWANDSDTLPGCWLAARRKHCRLVMDAHELFPELPEVQGRPLVQLAWKAINRLFMPCCDALLTVCNSFAQYYKEHLGVEMTVVRNVREWKSGKVEEWKSGKVDSATLPPYHFAAKKMLLYQGAVNVGRGVDWAIDALEWLPDCRLVVAGTGDLYEEMTAYAAQKPWADRIEFLGRLPHEELDRLTPQADVGLLMLEHMGLSYTLTLPNRVGDFVAAGVPMVVSDMPETVAVVRRYDIGEVIDRLHGADGKAQARALADAVRRLLDRWSRLSAAEREARFAPAREDLNWNNEKKKLLECLNVLMHEYSGTQTIKQ